MLSTQLASKREFVTAVEWQVQANSFREYDATAEGYVLPTNTTLAPLITRRLPTLKDMCVADTAGNVVSESGAFSALVAGETAPVPPSVEIFVNAVPVHFIRQARPTVARPLREKLGFELSYSHVNRAGATCEAEFWAQAQASGEQSGPRVTLQMEVSTLS